MIRYATTMPLAAREPRNFGDVILRQIAPASYGTADYYMLDAMRWMYRREEEAAKYGQQPRFSFNVRRQRVYDFNDREIDTLVISASLYDGLILCDRERNYHDDSDFYAIIWNPVERRCEYHEYATTRFGGGGFCQIDATDEVKAAAREYLATLLVDRFARDEERRASYVQKGRVVRFTRDYRPRKGAWAGHTISAGTRARVIWEGFDRYASQRLRQNVKRYGVKLLDAPEDAEPVWIGQGVVEVADPTAYMPPREEIEAAARRAAARDAFHLLTDPQMVVA